MELDEIERYYDAVPRAAATTEEVGPFTLFLADEGIGWQFYARPRLGGEDEFTADDIRRLFARQEELGVPRAIEWVDQITPSLLPAVSAAGLEAGCYPLLALPPDMEVSAPERTKALAADDADLALLVGAIHAAFTGEDQVTARPVGGRRDMITAGRLIEIAAYDTDGRLVGGGSAAPRGQTAELMGIGVPLTYRTAGVGTAITRALIVACRNAGVGAVFLSAYNDAAASIYRRIGFVDIGTACIAGADDG